MASMSQEEYDPKVLGPAIDRIYDALDEATHTEIARLSKEGVSADTCLQATVNASLALAAYYACNLISPESDPKNEEVQARIHRVRVAFTQALDPIVQRELRKVRGH